MADAINFASLKILVIDDQEFVRTIVRKMLGQLGVAQVLEAQDGNSGVDIAKAQLPDMVICDIQMRPLDGFGFVARLRETEETKAIPVIMLTAHTDAATIARAKELHIQAFLAKPVLPPALKDKITKVLTSGSAIG